MSGASTILDNGTKRVYAISTTGSDERSVALIESNVVIPVWPSWGGGRVVPVSLGGPQQDPFLLLAHHKHWFDPRDPLRKPFQVSTVALYCNVNSNPADGLFAINTDGWESAWITICRRRRLFHAPTPWIRYLNIHYGRLGRFPAS